MQLTLFGNDFREEFNNSNARRGSVRSKSRSEQANVYRRPGTGLVKCLHERSYFVECTKCKRTQRDGEAAFELFRSKLSEKTKAVISRY